MNTSSTQRPGSAAAWCLLLAPVAIVAGEALHPARPMLPAHQLGVVAANRQAWYVSHLLLFIGVALTIPALSALGALVRTRRPRLATAGVALAGAGAVCFAGLLTIGFVVGQMVASSADRQQMTALLTRLFHSPGFLVPFQAVPFLFAVGLAILAVGLRRAEAVTRLGAIRLSGGAVALCLIGIVPGSGYAIAASLVFAAGMAPIGRHLLRTPGQVNAVSVPAMTS